LKNLINVNLKVVKKGEWIEIICDECGKNFCLNHRSPDDHQCSGAIKDPKTKIRNLREDFLNKLNIKNGVSCGQEIHKKRKQKLEPQQNKKFINFSYVMNFTNNHALLEDNVDC